MAAVKNGNREQVEDSQINAQNRDEKDYTRGSLRSGCTARQKPSAHVGFSVSVGRLGRCSALGADGGVAREPGRVAVRRGLTETLPS